MFKKSSAIEKRRKRLQKELSSVHNNIKTLSKTVEKKGVLPDVALPDSSAVDQQHVEDVVSQDVPPVKQNIRKIGLRDDRFADYLANNLESMQPLRHVRRIQRNKAIATIVVVVILILWLLYRYFHL